MVEIRSQHVHLRPNSSIFMCVLQLRILKTIFRPISKNCRNVQILAKTKKSCREKARCQNPSATVRISEALFGRQKQRIMSRKCSLPKPLGHSEDFRNLVFEALMMLLS